MVQAILEDRKTMTCRLRGLDKVNKEPGDCKFDQAFTHIGKYERDKYVFRFVNSKGEFIDIVCPYGKAGDILWARETWANLNGDFANVQPYYVYKADFEHPDQHGPITLKPSIHMPKVAARIWLSVTDIRVERLHDISEEDAKAEGIKSFRPVPGDGPAQTLYYHYLKDKWGLSPIHSFETLWRKINGEESWLSNPFCWVICFRVLSTTGKPKEFFK